MIRYKSSRGHEIDGINANQTGNTSGDKQEKLTEENGQESSQQRTSSPVTDTEENEKSTNTNKRNKQKSTT